MVVQKDAGVVFCRRIGGGIQLVGTGVIQDGFGRRLGCLPALALVAGGIAHQGIGVAGLIEQVAGGIEQHPGFEGHGRIAGGPAHVVIVVGGRQQGDGLVAVLDDEIYAFGVGVSGNEQRLAVVEPEGFFYQGHASPVADQVKIVISPQKADLAGEPFLPLFIFERHQIDALQKDIAVADAFVIVGPLAELV